MRYVSWARSRTGRLLLILVAIVLYVLLLVADGLKFFPLATASPLLDLASFGLARFGKFWLLRLYRADVPGCRYPGLALCT